MNSRTVNKIIVKYIFFIPRLNNLLDTMAGSYIFLKFDLTVWVSSDSYLRD